MGKIALLAAALVFAFACMRSADAFSCYQCVYDIDEDVGDKSCKSGNKPDENLKKQCVYPRNLDDFPAVFHPLIEAQNNASRNAVAENKQINWGCGKFAIESVATIRMCVEMAGNTAKCDAGNVREMANGNSVWQAHAALFAILGYNSNSCSGCICTGENCNSGFSIKFSSTLLATSIALVFLKY